MVTDTVALLVYGNVHPDVVVLRWPEEARERERLEAHGVPRLWLVDPGGDPPAIATCLDDWAHLPADDADVRARIAALAVRARHHAPVPRMDEHGQFAYRGAVALLSPVEQRLARPLLDRFGQVVPEDVLADCAWNDAETDQTRRVHVSRLRRRLAPMGLTVARVRSVGYVMRVATD